MLVNLPTDEHKREGVVDMENMVPLGQFLAGLGIFFMGVGVLWCVSLQSGKE